MNKLFNENGFAIKDCRVTVYNYDRENNEYISSTMEHVVAGSGIPANSTFLKPLDHKDGFTQVFDEEKQEWQYVEDHRYDDVYNINTRQKEDIKYLGKLKPEHTLIAPPSMDHEFINGEWIITKEKQAELEAQAKQQEILEFEDQIKQLEQELLIAGMRGKDTTEINAELDALEVKLGELK